MGLNTKILSLSYMRKCNFTNFDSGHFENGVRPFGDGGIHFSCSDKSQKQNKIGSIHSWCGWEGFTRGISGTWISINGVI